MSDPIEGISKDLNGIIENTQGLLNNKSNFPPEREEDKKHLRNYLENITNASRDLHASTQKTHFVNCWFIGDRESVAMWDLYSNSDSVAIMANPSKLISSIESGLEILGTDFIFIGDKVNYDYIMPYDPFKASNKSKGPGMEKDVAYSHENEFRFLLHTKNYDENYEKIEVELPNFFLEENFKVICHPLMEKWKIKNVEELIKLYNVKAKVYLSEIKTKRG